MGTAASTSLRDSLSIGGVDLGGGLRPHFAPDLLARGLRNLIIFPENQVEVLRDYFPADLQQLLIGMRQALTAVAVGMPDRVEQTPDLDLARQVVDARETLIRFLFHPSLSATAESLAEIAQAFQTRKFGVAKTEVERLVALDTNVPHIDEELIETALHPDTLHLIELQDAGSSPGDPEDTHGQNEIRVEYLIPGYAGPRPERDQLVQLLGCYLLLSGTTELSGAVDRTFRLGLLGAEIELGLAGPRAEDLQGAIDRYDALLAGGSAFQPAQIKFLAIRAGLVRLEVADRHFRHRDLDINARNTILAEYDAAAALVASHGLSPLHPLRLKIDSTVAEQRSKLEAGLNFLGYKDSYVPVQTAQYYFTRASNRLTAAKAARDQFIAFLERATALSAETAQQLLNDQVERVSEAIAQERIGIAADQRTTVSQRVTAIQDQLDRLAQDSILSGLGAALVSVSSIAAGAITTGLSAGAAAGIGMVVAGAGVNSLVSYAARDEDLHNQLHIANTELQIADRQERIAKLEATIEGLRHRFAQERLQDLTGRPLNADVAYQLASFYQDLAETNLAVAIQWAYLYERAVAFTRLKPHLQVVQFDYRVAAPGFAGTIAAPDALENDLQQRLPEQDKPDEQAQTLRENPISLATSYPLEFARFQQTGTMDFVISMYDLDKRRRGVEKRRLQRVIVELIGTIPATGFAGHITHHGFFLLRDRESTMQASRLVPTDAEFAAAFAGLQTGKTQGDPIGGVIPYLLDKDGQDLSAEPPLDENNPEPTARALFYGRGETGRWTLEIDNIDTRRIVDVNLRFVIYFPERNDDLQTKVEELLTAYEQELAAGDALDKTAVVSLRHRFRDAFEQLRTGPATFSFTDRDFPLTDSDFPAHITDLKVKAVVVQALDANGTGVEGVTFEVRNQAGGFALTKTTGPGGFTEALDAPIPVVPRDQRVALMGAWQLALPDPGQFARLDDVRLFFIYEFQPVPTR
jgi:hypothetical protein